MAQEQRERNVLQDVQRARIIERRRDAGARRLRSFWANSIVSRS
jgi:hypothetical protein